MNLGGPSFIVSLLRGGSATADIVSEKLGSTGAVKKRRAGAHYDPIVVETAPGTPMDDAVRGFLLGTAQSSKGTLMDGPVSPGNELDLRNPSISEVVFPACDAESSDSGKLRVTLVPEYVRVAPRGSAAPGGSKGRPWSSRFFQLTLDGVEAQRVVRIDPITVRGSNTTNTIGDTGLHVSRPASPDISNVFITLSAASESTISGWLHWYQSFVIDGQAQATQERSFTLDLKSEDQRTTLATLTGNGVGIVSLRALPPSKSSAVRLYQVELYVQQLDLKGSGSK